MSEFILEIRDLEVRYGAAVAVKNVTIEVRKGSLVTVIGNNGAGKSSTVRAATGLLRPSAGTVKFAGHDTTLQPAHKKVAAGLVMVPEGRMIFPDQSVEDNLILGAYSRGGLKNQEARESLEHVLALFPRLKERFAQPAGSMSGGEQQMLAIGRGLMARPQLMIIDELSLGLAPQVVEQLMQVLVDLNTGGLTILLVEQLAAQALAISDYAYVVANGMIAKEGPSQMIASDPEIMESFLGKKKTQ